MTLPDSPGGAPRRQGRGLRRIESILDAAEQVIAVTGYEGATTNQIASAAGISPGSLYQYFANKSEVVAALARRYLVIFTAACDADGASRPAGRPAHQLVDRMVDPLVDFNLAHPAAKFLFAGTELSPDLAAATTDLHTALRHRAEALVHELAPARAARDQALTAAMSIQIVAASLPSILAADPSRRLALIEELKTALVGYWSAVAADPTGGR